MDIAVVVNLKARRGSNRVARACRAELPSARVMASSTMHEAAGFAKDLCENPPSLLVSAGGDGTVVALLNAIRAERRARLHPTAVASTHAAPLAETAFGLLPLGTGNGWARAMGAPGWRRGVAHLGKLAARGGPLPLRRFDLVEVGGTVAHFAGTGWDAEIIDDFHAQKTGWGVLPEKARAGLGGYLQGLFTRTIPRHLTTTSRTIVELVNTGDDAWTVDERGRAIPMRGGEHGKLLYRGPVSVCAAGTSPEWGFGFRAFPFAGLMQRRFCMRVYAGDAATATQNMRRLWLGAHPMEEMHTWLLTRCRATFSRPVPFQVGGDRLGHKSEVEYVLAKEQIEMLDWRGVA